MKAISISLKRAVTSLVITGDTMKMISSLATSKGFGGSEAASQLYREWVNDLVVDYAGPSFKAAAKMPDATFLAWAQARIDDPWRVTPRAHMPLIRLYGEEAVALFITVRWKQEVAWARRMRASDNDRITLLAERWLRETRKDPTTMLSEIISLYVKGVALEAEYSESDRHLMSEDEILDARPDDGGWRPLWLRLAEREYGKRVTELPRQHLGLMATKVRETEWKERTERVRHQMADNLRKHRPSLMVGVLSVAANLGISSDDLVVAEHLFIKEIEEGTLDPTMNQGPLWRTFLLRLSSATGISPFPTPEEETRRMTLIEQIAPSWMENLPGDLRRMGAAVKSNLLSWFDAILTQGRQVPLDPTVDFGLWLMETRGSTNE
jgi:hypothetical protein